MIDRVRQLLVALLMCGCDQLFQLDVVIVDDARAVDASAADALACPSNYLLSFSANPDSRYRFVSVPAAWPMAADDCATDAPGRTHLAVLDGEAERQELATLASIDDVWIGLTDIVVEGTQFWVTAEPTPIPEPGVAPWADGKPDDPNGGQDCARMSAFYAFLLDDGDCVSLNQYVCECDAFADDPVRYAPP